MDNKELEAAKHGNFRESAHKNKTRTAIELHCERKLTNQKLWKILFEINRAKVAVYMVQEKWSKDKRQRKWAKYFADYWRQDIDWSAKCLVYQIILPYSV